MNLDRIDDVLLFIFTDAILSSTDLVAIIIPTE